MRGRFVNKTSAAIGRYFKVSSHQFQLSNRYNVAPSSTFLSIRLIDGERALSQMRWGLIPFWPKDASIGYKMIKARAEPAATKPAFRAADKALRCLISAPGCEAWKRDVDPKLPHYLPKRDDSPIGFAGL